MMIFSFLTMDIQRSDQAVTCNDILEKVILKIVEGHQGFYFFPDDNRLAVSKKGEVLNVKTNNILKPIFNKGNRASIIITSPEVNPKAYKLHRLIARTFIGRPDRLKHIKYKKLEVNHIDGNSRNNTINNLEWVTCKENILHSNRILGDRSNTVSVLVKSLLNGNIHKFNTIRECAEYFNIHRATLWKHLMSGNSGKFKKDNCIFKLNNNSDWKLYDINLIRELSNGTAEKRYIIMDTHLRNNIFCNSDQAKTLLGISKKYFYKISNKKDIFTYRHYVITLF